MRSLSATVTGVLLLSGAIGTGVGGDPPPPPAVSGVKLDAPKVDTIPVANFKVYRIDVTGTLSLATGDTFDGFKLDVKDPSKTSVTPTLISFAAPPPGGTSTFKYTLYTLTPGTWTIEAGIDYKTGNAPDAKTRTDRRRAAVPDYRAAAVRPSGQSIED